MTSDIYEISKLKAFSWIPSLLAFFCVAFMIYITHYVCIPYYTRITGQPYLVGYLIGWIINVGILFVASLIAYKLEKNTFNLRDLSLRFRLKKMLGQDWLWTTILLLVALVTYFGFSFTSDWLISSKLFAPHPDWPPDMGHEGILNLKKGVLFGMTLQGKWWIAFAYFVGWVLNILGEEFWYRGWMLPRQEVAFGKNAWLMNGTMFTFQHWMQPWNFLAILPGALFISFIIQFRKNTWIGIIQHGLMNLGLFLYVLKGVLGW